MKSTDEPFYKWKPESDQMPHRFLGESEIPKNPLDAALKKIQDEREKNHLITADERVQVKGAAQDAVKNGVKEVAAALTEAETKAVAESKAAAQRLESEKRIKEALTIKKGESYAHCAERLLAQAGEKDPTAKQIRELSRQLWIADNRRKAGTLTTGQVLNIDENIRKNPNLKKLFAA